MAERNTQKNYDRPTGPHQKIGCFISLFSYYLGVYFIFCFICFFLAGGGSAVVVVLLSRLLFSHGQQKASVLNSAA
jgi:hypothetical protein